MDQTRANTPALIKANLMSEQLSVQMSWGNGGCTRADSSGDQQSRELGPWATRRFRVMMRANAWGHDELREVIYILLSIQIAMTYRLSHDMIMLLASLSHCERNHRDAHQANFNVNKEIIIMMTTESLIDRHLYYHIVFYCPIGEV